MNIDHEPLISLNLAEDSKRRERKPKRPRFIEENDENANERSDRFIIYFLLIYYIFRHGSQYLFSYLCGRCAKKYGSVALEGRVKK